MLKLDSPQLALIQAADSLCYIMWLAGSLIAGLCHSFQRSKFKAFDKLYISHLKVSDNCYRPATERTHCNVLFRLLLLRFFVNIFYNEHILFIVSVLIINAIELL